MSAPKMTLRKWLDTYDRAPEEGPDRVIAECACEENGYNPEGTCQGWVLTYARRRVPA